MTISAPPDDPIVRPLVRRLGAAISSSSVLLAIIYVLGYIYLKTYLAVFGFQIELSSFSITNLLLAHRFFVSQHFFVIAGVVHAYLLWRFGYQGLRRDPWPSLAIFGFPPFLTVVAFLLSIWSEAGIPAGLNLRAPGLALALLSGWLLGAALYAAVRWSVRSILTLRDLLPAMVAVLALAGLVATYRLYARVHALDKQARNEFQQVGDLRLSDNVSVPGPCDVIYVDSLSLFLRCVRVPTVVLRSNLLSYTVSAARSNSPAVQAATKPGK